MLVFADAVAREKIWATFRDDPEWLKLRALPRYTEGGDIVSVISSVLLRPTDYSQL
jgi:hypothetical protein